MSTQKQKGILLHVSSLPSPYRIGSFGREAYDFIDFLSSNGYNYWQMLPLGVTSYGDSPYQCLSAFAGNPYFVDIKMLVDEGLLTDAEARIEVASGNVDYGALWETRYKTLKKAFERFKPDAAYAEWVKNTPWLSDFTLYMAIKECFDFKPWWEWPDEFKFKDRLPNDFCELHGQICQFYAFLQFKFYQQFEALSTYAHKKEIKLIGDLPIYVSMDSAEVWATPELFLLNKEMKPLKVAAVPPDLFSEEGQLWGNPLYDWDYHRAQSFEWWHMRINHILSIFDLIRIDHFRAFESYYAVPFGATTAKIGAWEKGVELAPFKKIKSLIKGRIIAEDLGVITDEVRALLKKSGFPGMKVLQFAFGSDESNEYLPKNYKTSNCVIYTGTHDNDTSNGWYESADVKVKAFFDKVSGKKTNESAADAMTRMALASKARIAIIPMQDVLNLDGESRMNYPSKTGQWTFRLAPDYLNRSK